MAAQRASSEECRRTRGSRSRRSTLTMASIALLCWASTAQGLATREAVLTGTQLRTLLSHGGTMANEKCMENEYARGPLQQDPTIPPEEVVCDKCPANFRSSGVIWTTCKICPWNRFTDTTDFNNAGTGSRYAKVADQCTQVCDPKTTVGANPDRSGCLCAPGYEPFPASADYPDVRPILDRCKPCDADSYHIGGIDTASKNKNVAVGTCVACPGGLSTGGQVGQSQCRVCAYGYIPDPKSTSGCKQVLGCGAAGRIARPNGTDDCTKDYVCGVDFFTTWDYDAVTKTTTKNCNPCAGPNKGTNGAVDQNKCVCNKGYFKIATHSEDCWTCGAGTTGLKAGGGLNNACDCAEGYTNFEVDYATKTGKCTKCLPGWGWDTVGSKCSLCDKGTYSPAVGNTPCTTCEDGAIAPTKGATACKRCQITASGGVVDADGTRTVCGCKAGYYRTSNPKDTRDDTDNVCTPCPANTYNAASKFAGIGQCLPCPAGTSTNTAVGQLSCTACAVGWFKDKTADPNGGVCTKCTTIAGSTAPDGTTLFTTDPLACTQCKRGYYKVPAVAPATGFTCKVCDEASTRGILATGAGLTYGHDATTCTCREGYDPASFDATTGKCTKCKLGYEWLAGECKLCKQGFYRDTDPVAPLVATCKACTSGYANPARTACAACDATTTTGPNPKFERCDCAPGYSLFDPATAKCVRHEAELASIESYYEGLRNADPAYVVLSPTYGVEPSAVFQSVAGDGCPPDYFLGKDDRCYKCDGITTVTGNTYKSRGANATACDCAVGYKNFNNATGTCTTCWDGWEHTADKQACVKCGFTTTAPAYTTHTFATGAWFDGKTLLLGQCTPCPAGTERKADATSDPYAPCVACPRGKSSIPGGACTDCASLANHMVTLTDACKPCGQNWWSAPGALACTPCPPNTHRLSNMLSCSPCPLGMQRANSEPTCEYRSNLVAGTDRGLLAVSRTLSSKYVDGIAFTQTAADAKGKGVEVRSTLLVSYPTTSNPVEFRDAQIRTGLTNTSDGWVVGRAVGSIALPKIDFTGDIANCSSPAWLGTVAAWLEKAAGAGAKATVACHPKNNATLTSPELVRMLPQNVKVTGPGRRSLHQYYGCDAPVASVYAYITFGSEDPVSAKAVSDVQALAGTSDSSVGSVCHPMPVWPAAAISITGPLRLTAAGMKANASDACYSVKPMFDAQLRTLVPGMAPYSTECGTQDGQVLAAPVPEPPTPPPEEDDGLTKGQLAGIIVGSVCGGLLLIALIAFLLMRHRKKSSQAVSDKEYGSGGGAGSSAEQPLNPNPAVRDGSGIGRRHSSGTGGPPGYVGSGPSGGSPVPPSGSIVRVQVARGSSSTTQQTPVRGMAEVQN